MNGNPSWQLAGNPHLDKRKAREIHCKCLIYCADEFKNYKLSDILLSGINHFSSLHYMFVLVVRT